LLGYTYSNRIVLNFPVLHLIEYVMVWEMYGYCRTRMIGLHCVHDTNNQRAHFQLLFVFAVFLLISVHYVVVVAVAVAVTLRRNRELNACERSLSSLRYSLYTLCERLNNGYLCKFGSSQFTMVCRSVGARNTQTRSVGTHNTQHGAWTLPTRSLGALPNTIATQAHKLKLVKENTEC
jgi:hypothetical protein